METVFNLRDKNDIRLVDTKYGGIERRPVGLECEARQSCHSIEVGSALSRRVRVQWR